jgi:PAS domain S-box-containing protein
MYNIFVLEDEALVSLEIQERLQGFGYNVCGSASSGEEALKVLEQVKPDMALIDIRLKGEMTGIDVAKVLREKQHIPYVFLTSYSDKATLEKAKMTYPFAYLLKPVDEHALRTSIEITMIRNEMEQKLKERENWLYTTLRSIGEGVITTDKKGKISFMNPVAEDLTGWEKDAAMGRYFPEVFDIYSENGNADSKNPAIKAIREKKEIHTLDQIKMTRKDGKLAYIQAHTTPIIDSEEKVLGAVILFRNIITSEQN